MLIYLSTEDPRHEVLPTILSDGHSDSMNLTVVFVYVMSLGQTSLQALKRVSTVSIPKGILHTKLSKESVLSQFPTASHTNSSSYHLTHATCSININSNFIMSHAACVTLA